MGTITINRPGKLNCFDYETLIQLEAVVEEIELERETRAVIITGVGEKAFSVGADLKGRRTLLEKKV